MSWSRRQFIAGGTASVIASSGAADAPLLSPRPRLRDGTGPTIADLIANRPFAGQVGLQVFDLQTGQTVQAHAPELTHAPASVTKIFTALYALDRLGPHHRFRTSLHVTGPIVNGVVQGNLILAGGGDPTLDTDDLAGLAAALKGAGIRGINGAFLVWGGALPYQPQIDAGQLSYLGYNPAISGLNLNYNRVYFEWLRQNGRITTSMDARSDTYRPAVDIAQMTVVDRPAPLFTYRDTGVRDVWTVAEPALNTNGSRWLPVRHPALYAAEVFAVFARSHGIVLPPASLARTAPTGPGLAAINSAPLQDILRDMLRYSTNLTAEVVGLTASADQRTLRASATAMARWAGSRARRFTAQFVDHSGLGDASRLSPADMVRFLRATAVRAMLRPLLRDWPITDATGQPLLRGDILVSAKTGTLNFVSTLAGYVRTRDGRNLAFALFASDPGARAAGKRTKDESPRGARRWNRQVKALQQDILRQLALGA